MPEQRLQYWVEFAGQTYEAREVKGAEALSQPFFIEVRFAHEDGIPSPKDLVGSEVSVQLRRQSQQRSIDGVITDISLGAVLRGAPEVTLVVEPRFALTRLRQDIRVFRNKSVPEIVTEVLGGHGIQPELRLRESYATRPYCVQFRESDYNFVSRLLEDEGIFYFFAEGDRMILGDSPAAYDPVSGQAILPFRAGSAMDRNEDCVTAIGRRAVLVPSKVTLRDFNPETPSLDMDVRAETPCSSGPEFYDFPGEYDVPDDGARKVQKMAEALACESSVHVGETYCGRLVPGCTFELMEAPRGVASGKYAIVRVEHDFHLNQDGFSAAFEALPEEMPFRPKRVTVAPRLVNPVTGFVTGPPGEDIYTDAYGRVKVHFHWDRLQPYDDDCSHWVPVMQDNTGHSCSIPRIGWEVLVHFLEGDPDRPVVLGRVYNALDPPHLDLPMQKTRSQIKSLTSPRDDNRNNSGTNEIVFEDLAGHEFVQIFAEKDQNIRVANDKRETVLLNETTTVLRDESVFIGVNDTMTVGKDLLPIVVGNQSLSVAGNSTADVGGSEGSLVNGNHSLTIGGMHKRRISLTDSMTSNNLTEKVGGVILDTFVKGHTTTAMKAGALIVGGAIVEVAREDKSETSGLARAETIGGIVFAKAGSEIQTRANKKRSTTVGGMMKVSAMKEMTLSGVDKISTTSLSGSFTADKDITFKVGDSVIEMGEGVVSFKTPTTIKVTISGSNEQAAKKSSLIGG